MNEDTQARPAPGQFSEARPLVIGLGASVGAMSSIEAFFSRLTIEPDLAIVVVLQHREAFDERRLRDILRKRGEQKLLDVRDAMKVEGGAAYLCEADKITTLQDGHFSVRPAQQGPGERATIDSFLVSLAEQQGDHAIGVVLAGVGGDGTLGVGTLKDHGGLAVAERPREAEVEHIADSKTAAAIADFLLPAGEIPDHIHVYAGHLRRTEGRKGFDEVLAAAAGSLSRIADVLRNKTGNDFHGYKQNTFLRRVQRRMQVVQIPEIGAYVDS